MEGLNVHILLLLGQTFPWGVKKPAFPVNRKEMRMWCIHSPTPGNFMCVCVCVSVYFEITLLAAWHCAQADLGVTFGVVQLLPKIGWNQIYSLCWCLESHLTIERWYCFLPRLQGRKQNFDPLPLHLGSVGGNWRKSLHPNNRWVFGQVHSTNLQPGTGQNGAWRDPALLWSFPQQQL